MNGADQLELLADRVRRAMAADLQSYRTAMTTAAQAWVPETPADPEDLDADDDADDEREDDEDDPLAPCPTPLLDAAQIDAVLGAGEL